jgi:polyhydroxybutyrate depolymerase
MRKTIRWIVFVLAALAAILPLVMLLLFLIANQTNGEIRSSGKKRSYLLYVPKTYDPARPTPLVISIHGFAEWPAHQRDLSRWNKLADQSGFIVVYPMGNGFFPKYWSLRSDPGRPEQDPTLNVQFISDLIDKLEREYAIDPARIYANGLSNGGGMSFLLACKLSERITAIGGVSGAYLTPWSEYTPSRPVPMIVFHGTQDPIVPYLGGSSHNFQGPFPSIPDWIAELARRNGCDPTPIPLPDRDDISGMQYTGASPQSEVIFYTIDKGGHSWPGGKPLPEFIVGHTSQSIDATRMMWEFFQKHKL